MGITDQFLMANPHIARYLNNDISLKDICTLSELRTVNHRSMQLPILYAPEDIRYYPPSYTEEHFSIQNFIKILLYMVVDNRLEMTFRYRNCNCTEEDVEDLKQIISKAFQVGKAKYIEYIGCIEGFEIDVSYQMRGNMIINIELKLRLMEQYHGAVKDMYKFLKLCRYVQSQLVRAGKIRREMSQYEIARVLFNWVVLHVNYDTTYRKYSFTGYSALTYGYAVCQGFTALYNALCKLFGLQIVGMIGKSSGGRSRGTENHIWSFALLDGRNVYIDVTFGSPVMANAKDLQRFNINPLLFCDFEQFDISYRDLQRNHSWDQSLYG